jgi:hypothetical protein
MLVMLKITTSFEALSPPKHLKAKTLNQKNANETKQVPIKYNPELKFLSCAIRINPAA